MESEDKEEDITIHKKYHFGLCKDVVISEWLDNPDIY